VALSDVELCMEIAAKSIIIPLKESEPELNFLLVVNNSVILKFKAQTGTGLIKNLALCE